MVEKINGQFMKLRFPISQINELATQYMDELSDRDNELTTKITEEVFPSYGQKGYLTKKEFVTVCAWKTPRTESRCASNDEGFIREISGLAKATNSERLRIQAWTMLAGVKWPTASVFLHFAFSNQYPILDVRALWSLQTAVPSTYTFPFWETYTSYCRKLAGEAKVSMRLLDQALWKYSAENQKQIREC